MESPGPAAPTPAPGRPARRGYFLPGVIALAVLVAIGLFVGAGDLNHRAPRTLDGADVASQIALALQVQQGSAGPPKVDCTGPQPVRAGWTFTCTVAGRHGPETVRVVEVDGRGSLRWAIVR
jgi:Domain of unknown function (DUF4333)